MQKLRFLLLAAAAVFGLLIAARTMAGPLAFPISIRTPINIESLFALLITAALLLLRREAAAARSKAGPSVALAATLIVLLVIAGFWRAIGIYFLADDFVLVTRANAFYPGRVRELFTTAEASAFFRPLIHLTMAGTARWAHFNPELWRTNAVALHAMNALLVFALACRLDLSRMAALFAGALFAIHGLLPESVIWIAGWFGTLSTFFALAGLIFFLNHLASKGRARIWYGVASFLAMVFALLSKETAYVFPLLAVLFAWHRGRIREAAPMLGALFGGAVVVFAYRWILLGGIGGYADLSSGGPLLMRLSVVPVLRSLLLRIWAVLYFPINWSREPHVWLGLLTAAYVAALIWLAARPGGRRSLVFGVLFVLISALPPLEQLLIGPDLQKSRELYLPLAGFCLLMARAANGLQGRARWFIPAVAVAFNFAALQHNITIWRDVGITAQRTCEATAACSRSAKLTVNGVPGSFDGVYFLGVGFPECIGMAAHSPPPVIEPGSNKGADIRWNADRREIECDVRR